MKYVKLYTYFRLSGTELNDGFCHINTAKRYSDQNGVK